MRKKKKKNDPQKFGASQRHEGRLCARPKTRARMRVGVPGGTCRDREFSIATKLAFLVSRQGFQCRDRVLGNWSFGVMTVVLRRGLILCRNMIFGVATTTLQGKTEACRDKIFSVATGLARLVSQHGLLMSR